MNFIVYEKLNYAIILYKKYYYKLFKNNFLNNLFVIYNIFKY